MCRVLSLEEKVNQQLAEQEAARKRAAEESAKKVMNRAAADVNIFSPEAEEKGLRGKRNLKRKHIALFRKWELEDTHTFDPLKEKPSMSQWGQKKSEKMQEDIVKSESSDEEERKRDYIEAMEQLNESSLFQMMMGSFDLPEERTIDSTISSPPEPGVPDAAVLPLRKKIKLTRKQATTSSSSPPSSRTESSNEPSPQRMKPE